MFKRLKNADGKLFIGVMFAVAAALLAGIITAVDDGEFIWFVVGVIGALSFILDYYLAGLFYFLGVDKGYSARVYLWLAYLLPPVGYLLIVAMPDRGGNTAAILPDELPDL